MNDLKIHHSQLSASPQSCTKELSDYTQREWINKIYKHLNIKISKKTHAGRGSGARQAELMDIPTEEIQRAGRWAGDSMHRAYLTSLPRKFIRGMAGFQAEHSGTYFVARGQMEPSNDLIQLIFPKLDYWVNQPTDDIATKQFLKLLVYLRVVFLQDSVLLRAQYPEHSLWKLAVFRHPLYFSFASEVAGGLNENRDLDSQIRTAMPILGQQVLNLNNTLTGQVAEGFKTQLEATAKLEGKINDFLEGKISFALTPVRTQQLLAVANSADASIPIDPQPRPSPMGPANPAAVSFASPSKESSSSRSIPGSPAPPIYTLSRNIHTVTDLWREWNIGLGTSPSVSSLNTSYGDTWRRGWTGKEKEFYSKRLAIIQYIHKQANGGSAEVYATRLEDQRATERVTLNSLGVKFRRDKNR